MQYTKDYNIFVCSIFSFYIVYINIETYTTTLKRGVSQ